MTTTPDTVHAAEATTDPARLGSGGRSDGSPGGPGGRRGGLVRGGGLGPGGGRGRVDGVGRSGHRAPLELDETGTSACTLT